MNYEAKLYENLMNLTKESDSFFYIDQQLDNLTYRIFSYRLASYSDFCKPGAIEARGIMFMINNDQQPVLVCRPFKKFFNLNENPFTMNLDFSKAKYMMTKLDGSLISTFIHKGELRLKSKQSIFSQQAQDAMGWLNKPENKMFKSFIHSLVLLGFTVNLEYTSPGNRIVVGYDKTELTIIGVRNNETGELADLSQNVVAIRGINGDKKLPDWVRYVDIISSNPEEIKDIVSAVPDIVGIEGYVVAFPDQLVKMKTDWYVSLHRSRESVDIPSRLFDCIIEEATDDLRQLFSTDQFLLDKIKAMEDKVIPMYNGFCKQVCDFVSENKSLERKDFAIKGQKELPQYLFSLAMMSYLGKPLDMKAWAKKNVELFKIHDEV